MTAHMTMKITRKGQVMIPKPIRDRLRIHAGSKVDFEVADDGRFFLRKAEEPRRRRGRFARMRGTYWFCTESTSSTATGSSGYVRRGLQDRGATG